MRRFVCGLVASAALLAAQPFQIVERVPGCMEDYRAELESCTVHGSDPEDYGRCVETAKREYSWCVYGTQPYRERSPTQDDP
jgi:hypothetical protein